MMSRVLFALVAVLACVASVQAASCKSGAIALDNTDFSLCYSYTLTNLYIEASTTAVATNGWLAFGFSNGGMAGSSVILGSPAYGTSNFDLTSTSRPSGQIAGRTTLNATGAAVAVVAGKTVISYNIPLVNGAFTAGGATGGVAGSNYLATDGSAQIIYGRGPALAAAGTPAQHASLDKVVQGLTFTLDVATSSTGAAAAASSTAAAAVASSTASGPVVPPAASNSICDRYAAALGLNSAVGEYQLMNMLVTRAIVGNSSTNYGVSVEGLANNALTKPFFNGANPSYRSAAMNGTYGSGSSLPNFLVAGSAQSGLIDSLNKYFGWALGCSAGNFTTAYAYTGLVNMTAVHSAMPITQAVFNAFNLQVANAATSYGVSAADVSTVSGVLSSFQRGVAASSNTICNDVATCTCQSGLDGSAGTACTTKLGAASATAGVSAFSVIMAAAAAMFAMRQ